MAIIHETADEILVAPAQPCGTAVLTIAGASGRLDADRAKLLATHGALAMSIRWFGGAGQQPAPWHVPLETFFDALTRISSECDRLVIMGTSLGAEAALLTASHSPTVDAAIAFAPSAVVWGRSVDMGEGQVASRSHWTLHGAEVPYVPLLDGWRAAANPPEYLDWHESSLRAAGVRHEPAVIPVERIPEVVVVAGGNDLVWPAALSAAAIAQRRAACGMDTTVVTLAAAGHRTVLPGEGPARGGSQMAVGGSLAADGALGALAWPHIASTLNLNPSSWGHSHHLGQTPLQGV